MTYVMSDIHGSYADYLKMLDLIEFSAADALYIIGDVIDRGNDGIAILQDIMKRPNVYFLLGNHEDMMLNALTSKKQHGVDLWHGNGGEVTHACFDGLADEEQDAILAYLRNSPLRAFITVSGISYHLVHGCPSDDNDQKTLLWGRIRNSISFPTDRIIVSGHTPTLKYQSGTPMKIWYGNCGMVIDCGCAFPLHGGRLACLRLEDWQEFYIPTG